MNDSIKLAGPAALGQILCAAAVGAASFTSLRRYMAVKSLNPDIPVEPATEALAIPPNTVPWYKRIVSKKNGKALVAISILLSIEAFIIFGMPRLTTQFFMDSFWGSFEFFFMGLIIFSALGVLYPLKETAKYVRRKPDAPIQLVYTTESADHSTINKPGSRAALSAFLSLAVLGTSYHGSGALHPLVAAAWVAHMVCCVNLSGIRAKRLMQCLIGYVTLVPIIVGIIMLATGNFSSNDETAVPDAAAGASDAESKGSNYATPSDWMAGIMVIVNGAIPCVGPGVLTALALRFDWTRSNSPTLLSTDSLHVDPAVVPQSSPSFPKPHFTAAMIALIGSVLATPLAILIGFISIGSAPGEASIIEAVGLLVSAPAVVGALCFTAWMNGNFTELCEYTEMWVPKKLPEQKDAEKVDSVKADEVDKADSV